MYELIKAKMDEHIRQIVSKDKITDNEFRLLGDVLANEKEVEKHCNGLFDGFSWFIVLMILAIFSGGDHNGV